MKRSFSLILALLLALAVWGGVVAAEANEPDVFTTFISIDPSVTVENNKVITWFEELANVKFDFVISTGPEMITLLLSSGDYPEILLQGFSNNDIVNYGMTSEIFAPIDEYIDGHMPNVAGYFAEHPQFKTNMIAPNGRIYGVAQLPPSLGHGYIGMKAWINTEWLRAVGKEIPQTTDELYDVLVAFRDGDPNGNGLKDEIPFSGAINTWDAEPQYFLMNSFIYANKGNFINLENDEVQFVANTGAYREGIHYIKKLYDEGLLDPASFTQDLNQLIVLGQNPDIEILGAYAAGHVGMALDLEDIERSKMYAPLITLEGPEGKRYVSYGSPENRSGSAFAVTDACHDISRALEVIDLMFTEEVSITGEYGLENEGWKRADGGLLDFEGNPALYQSMTTRREQSATVIDYKFDPFRLCDTQRSKYAVVSDDIFDPDSQQYELRLMQATNEYMVHKPEETLPVIWADADTAERQAQLSVAITDYVKQATTRFITGDMNIDTEWEAYCEALDKMNLADYVQYYVDGYEAAKEKAQ